MQQGVERITLFYGKGQSLDPKAHVKALLRDLERIFGQERNNWSLVLLRSLWPALYPGITRRGRSLAHENTWLYLAGFVLCPGYGTELDPWRMTQLWECFSLGITHRKEKSAQLNWWMMWRRTADGLASEQQQQLFHAAQLVWAKPGQRRIYRLPKPRPDGQTVLTLTPLDLLDPLAALIPLPGGTGTAITRSRAQCPVACRGDRLYGPEI